METTLSKHDYQQLINKDLEWLEKQPHSLERDHIWMIVDQSPRREYPLSKHVDYTYDACGFQSRVAKEFCDKEILDDQSARYKIRNERFLEEALALVQACGMNSYAAHRLVDSIYSQPIGEASQEVGGVMVTLAALCQARHFNMHTAGETELARTLFMDKNFVGKQTAKPKSEPIAGSDVTEATPTRLFETKLHGLAVVGGERIVLCEPCLQRAIAKSMVIYSCAVPSPEQPAPNPPEQWQVVVGHGKGSDTLYPDLVGGPFHGTPVAVYLAEQQLQSTKGIAEIRIGTTAYGKEGFAVYINQKGTLTYDGQRSSEQAYDDDNARINGINARNLNNDSKHNPSKQWQVHNHKPSAQLQSGCKGCFPEVLSTADIERIVTAIVDRVMKQHSKESVATTTEYCVCNDPFRDVYVADGDGVLKHHDCNKVMACEFIGKQIHPATQRYLNRFVCGEHNNIVLNYCECEKQAGTVFTEGGLLKHSSCGNIVSCEYDNGGGWKHPATNQHADHLVCYEHLTKLLDDNK